MSRVRSALAPTPERFPECEPAAQDVLVTMVMSAATARPDYGRLLRRGATTHQITQTCDWTSTRRAAPGSDRRDRTTATRSASARAGRARHQGARRPRPRNGRCASMRSRRSMEFREFGGQAIASRRSRRADADVEAPNPGRSARPTNGRMKSIAATEVKNRPGAIVDAAQREPIVIRRQDRDIAVILSMADYDRLRSANVRAFLICVTRSPQTRPTPGLTDGLLTELLNDDDT
jgi:prevent-host-death family protein